MFYLVLTKLCQNTKHMQKETYTKYSVVNLVNTFKQTFEPNDFSMTLSSWWVASWGGWVGGRGNSQDAKKIQVGLSIDFHN